MPLPNHHGPPQVYFSMNMYPYWQVPQYRIAYVLLVPFVQALDNSSTCACAPPICKLQLLSDGIYPMGKDLTTSLKTSECLVLYVYNVQSIMYA